jgi:hypothetical protein
MLRARWNRQVLAATLVALVASALSVATAFAGGDAIPFPK